MSGIYGGTKRYVPNLLERKMQVFKFRGPANTILETYNVGEEKLTLGINVSYGVELKTINVEPENVSVVMDGSLYGKTNQKRNDIETLGNLYDQYGIDCLKYINGDYSFVLYDHMKNVLFGAVDRIGIKPLFYFYGEDGFEFCSNLFPLCIGNDYQIDSYSRQCYFAMQYIPAPFSIFKELRKLKAGEYFLYDLSTKQLKIEKYWDLYDNTSEFVAPRKYEEAVEIAEQLIKESINQRMSNCGRKAVLLSGGIDSSLISKYVFEENNSVEAYSVSFSEKGFDESYYAEKVAQCIGVKHHKILFSSADAIKIIDGLQKYYDEPMGDASAIPSSYICQMVSKENDVVLGGDGGDEVFFGYPRYLRYNRRAWIYSLPMPLRKSLAFFMKIGGFEREEISLKMKDVQELYLNRRSVYPAEKFNALHIQRTIEQIEYLYGNPDVRRAFNDFDIKSIMCYALNVKMDRAAARVALDDRFPFLDYRLLEYSRLIPLDYLYDKDNGQKRILRELLYRDLPRELFERKKRGFGVPTGGWFRNELKDYLVNVVSREAESIIPEYDMDGLLQMRDDHISGKADYSALLWLVVNYIEWSKIYKETVMFSVV